MHDALKSVTGQIAGAVLTPHQFRHLAAHLYLQAYPGEFETVRQLLGHKSLETTIRFYAGTQVDVACARLDDIITGSSRALRRPGTPTKRRKGRR